MITDVRNSKVKLFCKVIQTQKISSVDNLKYECDGSGLLLNSLSRL